MLPPRRRSTARLVALFLALGLLLAASLALQARWLGQLAAAQRAQSRHVLAAAAERLAADAQAELARFTDALRPDGTCPPPRDAWILDLRPIAPGEEDEPGAPSLRLPPAAPGGPERRLVLDREALGRELFPSLARAALGEDGLESLRVAVVPRAGGPPLWDSRPGEPLAGAPDASAGLRLEVSRWVSFRDDAGGPPVELPGPVFVSSPAGGTPLADLTQEPPWRVEIRHRAGSLEEATAAARRRNLWIGALLTAALGASFVLFFLGQERARRLAERELAFVAGVSHELRTPLAVIRSAASNLRKGLVREPERVGEYGALIEREAARVGESVERVLRFRASEPAAPRERVRLGDVVADALERTRLLLDGSPGAVEVDVPEELEVPAQRADLVAGVQNLLENAARYGPAEQTVRVRAFPEGGDAVLRVSDEGPGLHPDERAHVFEPFRRGRAATNGAPGSGLGLALVAEVARAHGGSVRALDAAGGACLELRLPLAGREGRP